MEGPWRYLEAVEFATLVWIDWFDNPRLLGPIGGHPTRRVRSAVLCSDQGGLIQRIRSPTFPARFK